VSLQGGVASSYVLLHLPRARPGCTRAPGGAECLGDHKSGSTSGLMSMLQRGSISPRPGRRGSSTAYLMRSPTNARRLLDAMENMESAEGDVHEVIDVVDD